MATAEHHDFRTSQLFFFYLAVCIKHTTYLTVHKTVRVRVVSFFVQQKSNFAIFKILNFGAGVPDLFAPMILMLNHRTIALLSVYSEYLNSCLLHYYFCLLYLIVVLLLRYGCGALVL